MRPSASAARVVSFHHLYQVLHSEDHAANLMIVWLLDNLIDSSQPERAHRVLLALFVANRAANELDLNVLADSVLSIAFTCSSHWNQLAQLLSAPSRNLGGVLEVLERLTVARTRLIGFELPSDLVRMSRRPAASTTARTAPPAMRRFLARPA